MCACHFVWLCVCVCVCLPVLCACVCVSACLFVRVCVPVCVCVQDYLLAMSLQQAQGEAPGPPSDLQLARQL